MLRLNEIKLPLDHTEEDLRAAIITRLKIGAKDLLRTTVFKRSYDARKKSNILLVYQLDVELTNEAEAAVLDSDLDESTVRPSPDTDYHFVAEAAVNFPAGEQQRPIVIASCQLWYWRRWG